MLGCSWHCQAMEERLPRGWCLWPEESWSTLGTTGLFYYRFLKIWGFWSKRGSNFQVNPESSFSAVLTQDLWHGLGAAPSPFSESPGVLPAAPELRRGLLPAARRPCPGSGGNLPAPPGGGLRASPPTPAFWTPEAGLVGVPGMLWRPAKVRVESPCKTTNRQKPARSKTAVIKQQRFGNWGAGGEGGKGDDERTGEPGEEFRSNGT